MKTGIVAIFLVVAVSAVFALGRTTASSAVLDSHGKTSSRDFTGRIGDSFRVPAVGLYCVIYVEQLVRSSYAITPTRSLGTR